MAPVLPSLRRVQTSPLQEEQNGRAHAWAEEAARATACRGERTERDRSLGTRLYRRDKKRRSAGDPERPQVAVHEDPACPAAARSVGVGSDSRGAGDARDEDNHK